MKRRFSPGSRPAPDPYDHYLEQHGYYRKHCPRDSTSLFRVISEQVYDTQHHHLLLRERCIEYMRKHRYFFQNLINTDYDEYLNDLSKQTTFGTIKELIVMGRFFRRNVILFGAYDTGRVLLQLPGNKDTFRVFSAFGKHFDSVFTNDFVEDAAFCQSICYKILYSKVFKIPDVEFAVSMMLYPKTDDVKAGSTDSNHSLKPIEYNNDQVQNFDSAEETNCILEDFNLCHFHNPNFVEFSYKLNRKYFAMQNYYQSDTDTRRLKKTIDSLLEKEHMSCVRQLLETGITPFPYKVAKALDPYMYRNIEFDVWTERRKALRLGNNQKDQISQRKLTQNQEARNGKEQNNSKFDNLSVAFNSTLPLPTNGVQQEPSFNPDSSLHPQGTSTPKMSRATASSGIGINTTPQNRRTSFFRPRGVNIAAPRSDNVLGNDLPQDMPTLRYFYNLGWDYFNRLYHNIHQREGGRNPNRPGKYIHRFYNKNCALENRPQINSNDDCNKNQAEAHPYYTNNEKDRPAIEYSNEASADGECNKIIEYTKTDFSSGNLSNLAVADGIPWQITNAEYFENPATWNHPPYAPYFTACPAEGSDGPTNVLVPQQLLPFPYGLYGPQMSSGSLPPPPTHLSSFSPYMGAIPPQHPIPVPGGPFPSYPSGFYTSGYESTDSCDAGQFAVFSYSPIYYPPNSSPAAAAGSATQGFWYPALPPPMLPLNMSTGTATPINSNGSANADQNNVYNNCTQKSGLY